jgi:hypothetical protein
MRMSRGSGGKLAEWRPNLIALSDVHSWFADPQHSPSKQTRCTSCRSVTGP